jgi:hypothetical protein
MGGENEWGEIYTSLLCSQGDQQPMAYYLWIPRPVRVR